MSATDDRGTCRRVYTDKPMFVRGYTCSHCDYDASNDEWNYCPICGRRYTNTTREAYEDRFNMSKGAKRIYNRLMDSLDGYKPNLAGDV